MRRRAPEILLHTLLTIAGGVALILFGIRYLRRGLDRLFGQRLGPWLNRVAGNRLSAFMSGLGLALLAPSSTTMSFLAVQTVQAGHLGVRRMLAVMLGVNIGLTVMVQLIALRLDAQAPVLVLIGVVLFQFTSAARTRGVGQVLLSFGFIFLGMGLIRGAVASADLAGNADFVQLVSLAESYPWLLLVLAAVIAILLQSSTATLGLLIGLAGAEILSMPVVIPFVLGTNIGLSLTTLIVGWGRVDSRRLALGNLTMKITVAGLTLAAVTPFMDELATWSGGVQAALIAGIHSTFNILVAAIGLPAIPLIAGLVQKLVPDPAPGNAAQGPRYLGSTAVLGPAMAMGQSLLEINHMADVVRSMLADVWTALKTGDEALAREVGERDDEVDELDRAIKRHLTRLISDEVATSEADEQMRQLRYLSEIETIGDIIDKNIVELVLKTIRHGARFSTDGASELDTFHAMVLENFDIAVVAFTGRDRRLAMKLLRHKDRIKTYGRELRDRHFERLTAGTDLSHESSAIHLDLLTHLDRINSALTQVAYAITRDGEHESGGRG